jgi:hypothetical protein
MLDFKLGVIFHEVARTSSPHPSHPHQPTNITILPPTDILDHLSPTLQKYTSLGSNPNPSHHSSNPSIPGPFSTSPF